MFGAFLVAGYQKMDHSNMTADKSFSTMAVFI